MARDVFKYLDGSLVEKLRKTVGECLSNGTSPDDLLLQLKGVLPVHRKDRETWKIRVEGLHEASQLIMDQIVERSRSNGNALDVEGVKKKAKLRPLSYYHYVTGSREPAENVMKDTDMYNDPTTALVKLEDDILALTRYYRSM